jgi:hypothetical protein
MTLFSPSNRPGPISPNVPDLGTDPADAILVTINVIMYLQIENEQHDKYLGMADSDRAPLKVRVTSSEGHLDKG